MKNETNSSAVGELTDASLVIASCGGDRQAFGEIVTRYQRLLCSLAYSSVGNLSESEDVAQEAFVEAWKKLGSLREPDKLKAWLCGILRHKISRYRRTESRQPLGSADELHEADGVHSNDESIEGVVMKEQEQTLLWTALETVPETYRETMILYYREEQSIAHVASQLDLTEDAVKQRLSRGRKLLQEKMMTFVEGALTRSAPRQAFTIGVLSAVATLAPSAQAAGAGATAVKVGSTFKWATIITFVASASGFISSFFALRATLDQSRTKRERRAVVKTVASIFGAVAIFVVGMLGMRYLALTSSDNAAALAALSQLLVGAFVVFILVVTARSMKRTRELRASERLRRPDLFESAVDQPNAKAREFKSRLTLLGVPLVHVKFAMPEGKEKPAVGWIAAGEVAYGLLFAWGGYAVAPISVGIISFGLVTVGAVGFGLLSMGTIGVGVIAMGASAIGYKAYGSLSALGWENAFSQGFSIAKEAALGPIAFAEHVNNEVAASISNLSRVGESYVVVLGVMTVLVIVPVVLYARAVRKKMRRPSSGE